MDKIEITKNFGQNKYEAEEFGRLVKEMLEPLEKSGLIQVKGITRRICDFCGKTLEEGDKFETIGDKDKCEDCSRTL